MTTTEIVSGTVQDPNPLATWRHTYQTFMQSFIADPSASALLALVESTTGCIAFITDGDGEVVGSSPGYVGPTHHTPPPVVELLGARKWLDGNAVSTPIAAPGSYFVWLLDGADPAEPIHQAALTIITELAWLVKSFAFPGIPPKLLEKGHLLERMLRGSDPAKLFSDGLRLGYDLERSAHVVVVEPTSGPTAVTLAQAIGPRVRRHGLLTTRDNRLVIGVLGDGHLEELLQSLADITDVGEFRVGVSATQKDAYDLRRALDQAVATLRLPATGSSIVTRFEQQDPLATITHLADPQIIALFIERTIGALVAYGRTHRGDLLLTLGAWLETTNSLEALAEELHIHKNTLTYRIRRIKELLDDDLSDGRHRFDVALALRLLDQSQESRPAHAG